MRTWKWIAGMLSILFSFLVMLQSALSGVFNLITQNGEMSGTAGLLVAILMMAGGIMSFLSRNENKNQRNLCLAIIFGIAAYLGVTYAGNYQDLHIWATWCFLNAILGLTTFIKQSL